MINYVTPRLRSKFGERAFSYAGPAAWNRLPETIRQAQELFNKLLKTFHSQNLITVVILVMFCCSICKWTQNHDDDDDDDDDNL